MADIQGSYDDLFTAVPNALAGLLDDGDAGASVAVFVDGEPVVDVWGGFADTDRTIPWQRDTITNVWSVTKTMTALCALVLADRGDLDLAAPVGRYWPEFATAGKDEGAGAAPARAHRGPARLGRADRGALRLAVRHGTSGRAGSAMGTGQRGRIPLAHPGVSRGRGRAPDHRPKPGRRSSQRRWPDRWVPTSTSACPPSTTTGWRSPSRRRPGTRTTPRAPPAAARLPPPAPPYGSVTGTAWPGVARRSPRRAASATPARSPSCSRCWPAEERCVGCGCCRRRAATVPGRSSSAARTAVLGMPVR